MGRNRVLSLFSSGRSHYNHPPAPESFLSNLMEDNISSAEISIALWTPPSAATTSLFASDREAVNQFLRSISDLQNAIDFFSSPDCASSSASRSLARAQSLMQTAMRRLEKEFSQILSSNRDRLDPDSVPRSSSVRSNHSSSSSDGGAFSDDETRAASNSITAVHIASTATADDIRTIADAMISASYSRECALVYKLIRKSIVDEGLYRLGFERLTASQISKLDWGALQLKIRAWLAAAPIAVRFLFAGERTLCDHVFSGALRDSCFTEVVSTAATAFFTFPELVAKLRPSPEKLFRVLDLYDAISGLWPEIVSIFSGDGGAAVRSQTLATQLKLAESARATLTEFESSIHRDASKTIVPGGGVHPLTRYATKYLVSLADYTTTLADIYAGYPFEFPDSLSEPLADMADPNSPDGGGSIEMRMAWLLLVVLCKMDGKAEAYGSVALSYLFLANNVEYVTAKVRNSRLRLLVGDGWVVRYRSKVSLYIAKYERLAWEAVTAALTVSEFGPVEAREAMSRFNVAFEEACRTQEGWVVCDVGMKLEVRVAVVNKIVPAYQCFYQRCRAVLRGGGAEVVRFAPEDVRKRLCGMLSGSGGTGFSRGLARSIGSKFTFVE